MKWGEKNADVTEITDVTEKREKAEMRDECRGNKKRGDGSILA